MAINTKQKKGNQGKDAGSTDVQGGINLSVWSPTE